MGSTDSDQVIIHLYPIGHAMIPSSGIMSSPGDRQQPWPSVAHTRRETFSTSATDPYIPPRLLIQEETPSPQTLPLDPKMKRKKQEKSTKGNTKKKHSTVEKTKKSKRKIVHSKTKESTHPKNKIKPPNPKLSTLL
jgi:hypothetical protein